MKRRTQVLLTAALALFAGREATAQEKPAPANLPDAPKPKPDPSDVGQKQDKNIFATPLGLITRKSYVYPELATSPGPLTSREKFELFLSKSIAAPQILSSAAGAGMSEARGTLAGYGQGGEGFGKRFGSSMASGASSHFFGTFLLPAVLHEDPRFFVKLHGGFKVRAGHALRRALVIRTDAGKDTFNLPGILGPMLAEGLANTYLPDSERTAGKTFERYGIRLAFSAGNNLLKEYWPTIFKRLRIGKVAPGLQPDATQPAPQSGPPN
ncbi:MAG: hypothetical protein WBR10_01830 [Candidatus Acidiferrum sp.]